MNNDDVSESVWQLLQDGNRYLAMPGSELRERSEEFSDFLTAINDELEHLSNAFQESAQRSDPGIPLDLKFDASAMTILCEALTYHLQQQDFAKAEAWATYFWSQAAVIGHAADRDILGPAILANADFNLRHGDRDYALNNYVAITEDFAIVLDIVDARFGKVNLNREHVAIQCLRAAADNVIRLQVSPESVQNAETIIKRLDSMHEMLLVMESQFTSPAEITDTDAVVANLTHDLMSTRPIAFDKESILREISCRM